MTLGMVVAAPAHADYQIDLTPSVLHDSNIFRVPSELRATLPHDGADRIAGISAGATISATPRWGDLQAQGALSRYWFGTFGYLDNTAYTFSGTLHHDERSGTLDLTAASSRRLISFEDNLRTTRDIQRLSTGTVDATRALLGDFRVVGGASVQANHNSDPLVALNDYTRVGYHAGFGYYSPTGSIIALEAATASTSGAQTRTAQVGAALVTYRTAFRERAVQLHLLWLPSVLWRIEARGGYTTHRDRSGLSGSFSGLTGQFDARWSPRDAIQLELGARRSFDSQSAVFSNGVRVGSVSAKLTGQATDRLSLMLETERRWRLFRFDLQAPSLSGHSERIDSGTATLAYVVNRRATMSLVGEAGRRTSSEAIFRYRYTSIAASLEVGFGNAPTRITPHS